MSSETGKRVVTIAIEDFLAYCGRGFTKRGSKAAKRKAKAKSKKKAEKQAKEKAMGKIPKRVHFEDEGSAQGDKDSNGSKKDADGDDDSD